MYSNIECRTWWSPSPSLSPSPSPSHTFRSLAPKRVRQSLHARVFSLFIPHPEEYRTRYRPWPRLAPACGCRSECCEQAERRLQNGQHESCRLLLVPLLLLHTHTLSPIAVACNWQAAQRRATRHESAARYSSPSPSPSPPPDKPPWNLWSLPRPFHAERYCTDEAAAAVTAAAPSPRVDIWAATTVWSREYTRCLHRYSSLFVPGYKWYCSPLTSHSPISQSSDLWIGIHL